MDRRVLLGLGGVVGIAVVAFLAFGVFGIHTAFTDNEVSEADPFSTQGVSGIASDDVSNDTAEAMNDFMVDNEVPAEVAAADEMPDMPEIVRVVEGTFIDRSHPGVGTAVVLSDGGPQRFLRLEDDFATDNGPDLNVYLVRNVTADGPSGEFDDDFVDLGDLKGNIGAQNYEVPADLDVTEYNTVVIWCVRFGVAFAAADMS